ESNLPPRSEQMLRVLFVQTDDVAANVRIRPLLEALSDAGEIRYAAVDRNMAVTGARSDKYEVLLSHRNLSRRQHGWLTSHRIPFVYDIDDLLLSGEVHGARRVAEQQAIRWCLEHAATVTAPSRRLLQVIDQKLPRGLGPRASHLPNPGRDAVPLNKIPGLP